MLHASGAEGHRSDGEHVDGTQWDLLSSPRCRIDVGLLLLLLSTANEPVLCGVVDTGLT